MARIDLKHYDFLRMVAQKSKRSPETVEKVLDALLEILYEELRLHGRIRIKNLGLFETKKTGGYEKEFKMPNGNILNRWVDVREKITFNASEKMYDNINGRGLSHEYKKRKKQGKLTPQDLELEELFTQNAEYNADIELDKIIRSKKEKKGRDTEDGEEG
jgi:nucleoid DNA-binding protein